jgi:trafficking protein particle complex subunit 11
MYYVRWRRANGAAPAAVAKTALPAIRVRELPVRVSLELPSFGVVRQPFTAVYTVYNSSNIVQELEVSIESTDGFMFSGNRVYRVRVAPQASQQLCYNYYPLLIGEIEMPRLNLVLTRPKLNLTDYLRRALSTHIFIKPAGKEPERLLASGTA